MKFLPFIFILVFTGVAQAGWTDVLGSAKIKPADPKTTRTIIKLPDEKVGRKPIEKPQEISTQQTFRKPEPFLKDSITTRIDADTTATLKQKIWLH